MKDEVLENLLRQVQIHLNTVGYKLVADGKMGKKTYNAVVKRQNADVKPQPAPKNWRVAASLLQLRGQIDALHPGRDKSGDGTIGDAAHKSRKSDHNAWVIDKNGQPVVTALDITHDPAHGVSGIDLAAELTQDVRVKYIIWAGRIWESKDRRWDAYDGENRHDHHIHISVHPTDNLFDNKTPWRL